MVILIVGLQDVLKGQAGDVLSPTVGAVALLSRHWRRGRALTLDPSLVPPHAATCPVQGAGRDQESVVVKNLRSMILELREAVGVLRSRALYFFCGPGSSRFVNLLLMDCRLRDVTA